MLLTVIAVATLLVAVVGATFAYFSIADVESKSTTITATTEKVGTVAVTNAEGLQISISAADMAEDAKNSTYFATTSGSKPHVESKTMEDLVTLTLSGSETATNYTCTGDVKIKLEGQTPSDGGLDATLPEFKSGDGKLYLAGPTNINGSQGTEFEIGLDTLKSETAESDNTKTISGVIFKLSGSDTTKKLTGTLEIDNTEEEQNHLIHKAFKVTVTLENVKCEIDANE